MYFVTDKLQGVCVAGDKLFLLQNDSPQLLNWEKYGLRIAIPQGAVQQSDTVEVAITALVGGEFILPEDTELVSVVYAISVSKPLLKPVQLELQHCVSIEKPAHSNYLSFATAHSDRPPYHFQPVEGGIFSIGNQYGSISLSGFSLWSIIKKKFRRRGHSQSSTTSALSPLSNTPLSSSPAIVSVPLSPPSTDNTAASSAPSTDNTAASSAPSTDNTAASSAPSTDNTAASSAPSTDNTAASSAPSTDNTAASSAPSTDNTAASSAPSTDNTAASSAPSTDVTAASSAPSTDNTVASSDNVSVESSSSVSYTVDDALHHSVKGKYN